MKERHRESYTVTTSGTGWAVVRGKQVVREGFATNAAAWRWLDRQMGDPISRQESVAEWIWSKQTEL
jgi:hypothetical protein